jgi:pimeloyl-ACP methyl ester carboxylesterase
VTGVDPPLVQIDTGAMRPSSPVSPQSPSSPEPPVSPPSPVSVVELNGARLAFQLFGDGSPTIILVAGAASSMDWWDDAFCELLAAGDAHRGRRRVIRYDFRDTGQSETVEPGAATYTGRDLVDDLAALAQYVLTEHDTDGSIHLVGLSMGGALVQRFALLHPELIATITLMSTTPIGDTTTPLPPPTARIAASFSAEQPSIDASGDAVMAEAAVEGERLYSGSIPIDEDRIRQIATSALSRTSSPASANNHWMIADGPGREDVTSIVAPTLVIHGSEDPMFPLPHGKHLAELIPGARLVVVPGMGHQFPPPPSWPLIVDEILGHTAAFGGPGSVPSSAPDARASSEH